MSRASQTAECIALLFGKVISKRGPIPIHVNKADILDDIPSDGELWLVVRELLKGCATGASGPQAENINVKV
jgi:hypothetical protein